MNWTILATLLTGINGLAAAIVPADSKWGPVVTAAIGLLATLAAKLAPAGLKPTKSDPLDALGPVAGKASGEAFDKASRGPFGPLLLFLASALVLAATACDTAKICRGLPGSTLRPVAYRFQSDPPSGQGHAFVSATATWNGNADPQTCGLPNAVVQDGALGIYLEGTIFLEGTGDWSNGLTGHEEPVFVGSGVVFDPSLPPSFFRDETGVTAIFIPE